MNIKKWVALVMTVAVLCTAFSGLTLVKAADYTLATDYEPSSTLEAVISGENCVRGAADVIRYVWGFDAKDTYASSDFSNVQQYYEKGGTNYTSTNPYGCEIAVNKYGIVVSVTNGVGNTAIPEDGYVISAHGDDSDWGYRTTLYNGVQEGDAAFCYYDDTTKTSTVYFYRTTDDSDYTHDSRSCEIKRSGLVNDDVVLPGEDSPTATYNTDVLVKLVDGTVTAGQYNKGYVVKYGNFGTENVPEGYIVLPLDGQSLVDNEGSEEVSIPAYTASYAFERYGAIGALVSVNLDENSNLASSVFFRFDVLSAVRNAMLLTGIGGEMGVGSAESGGTTECTIGEDDFFDSARAILEDAKTNYRLVDIDTMQTLYNQMYACASDMVTKYNNGEFATKNDIEPYHVTIKSLYQQIYDLSFETRTVEMRATWWRPFNNTGTDVRDLDAEGIDAFLEDKIISLKKLGYNMIFVETLFNSTTIYPIPEGVGYAGLSFKHNPNLVPTSQGGLNTALSEPYDMLQAIIDICHKNDVEPHIQWTTCYVAYHRTSENSDDQFEHSIATIIENDTTGTYTDWMNKNFDGTYEYYIGYSTYHHFLNPASEGAKQFLLNNFEHVMRTYDVESIQLDYIRYPEATDGYYYGYDDTTIKGFMASSYYSSTNHGTTFDAVKTTLQTYPMGENWVKYRADQVTDLVSRIYALRNEVAPHIAITSSPGADMDDSLMKLCQDARTWLTNGYIDIVFPMAYGQNVPGHIAQDMVNTCGGTTASGKFVCIGTDNDYFSEEYEMRWLRETRAAGADGIASFCESKLYANEEGDVWTTPAVTPTGNAAVAAITYITDTVNARIAKMLSLGDIDAAGQATLLEATKALSETIHIYGIASADFTALQTAANAIGGNPAAAIANDITYLEKIQKNSRDEAKEHAAVALDPGVTLKIGTATLDQDNAQATPAFAYSAATNVLIITTTTTLTGVAPAGLEIYIEGGDTAKTVHFNGVSGQDGSDIAVAALANTSLSNVTIRLSGTTVMSSVDVLGDAKHVYGVGVINDAEGTILRCQGDVNGDDKITTADVRTLLRYNVRSENLTTEQASRCDANGDGKINTTDTRLFLEKSLNLIV